jgi:hypothetical protein
MNTTPYFEVSWRYRNETLVERYTSRHEAMRAIADARYLRIAAWLSHASDR